MFDAIGSILDYTLHFGLPGLLIGLVFLWVIVRKISVEKQGKVLRIGAFAFIIPYVLDMIFFGITSYVSLVIYGCLGLAGILLGAYAIYRKEWLSAILYIAPIGLVIATITILGP